MITLDNSAVEYFCSTMKGGIVRLSLKGGGCNGFTYDWQLLENLEEVQENDEVFDYDEFTFVVDGMSLIFLAGSTVEYKKILSVVI